MSRITKLKRTLSKDYEERNLQGREERERIVIKGVWNGLT